MESTGSRFSMLRRFDKMSGKGLHYDAFTDYPFEEFGDVPGEIAPIRKAKILGYDGDKYVYVLVSNGSNDYNFERSFVFTSIKQWYVYKRRCRLDDARKKDCFSYRELGRLTNIFKDREFFFGL